MSVTAFRTPSWFTGWNEGMGDDGAEEARPPDKIHHIVIVIERALSDMSGFYHRLSDVYDIVFPENDKTAAFLLDCLENDSRVLDIACGTGTYAHALAREGHRVVGVDLDGTMTAKAREKYDDPSLEFVTGDMLRIDELFGRERFDMAYCIGNSIAHLPDAASVERLCGKVHGLLSGGGVFVVQTVNFDGMFEHLTAGPPPIRREREGVTFVRRYEFTGDSHVLFNSELHVGGEVTLDSVRLLALRSRDLVRILESRGFSEVELFGDFEKSEHTNRSPAVVVKAVK